MAKREGNKLVKIVDPKTGWKIEYSNVS